VNFRINECDASLIGEALKKLTETNPEEGIVSDAERIYGELQNQMKNQSALTIEELSQQYGSLDLLTSYIMRNFGVTEAVAEGLVYSADQMLEQMINEKLEDDEDDIEEEEE